MTLNHRPVWKNPCQDHIFSQLIPIWLIVLVGKGCAVTLNQVSMLKMKVIPDPCVKVLYMYVLSQWPYQQFATNSPIDQCLGDKGCAMI